MPRPYAAQTPVRSPDDDDERKISFTGALPRTQSTSCKTWEEGRRKRLKPNIPPFSLDVAIIASSDLTVRSFPSQTQALPRLYDAQRDGNPLSHRPVEARV